MVRSRLRACLARLALLLGVALLAACGGAPPVATTSVPPAAASPRERPSPSRTAATPSVVPAPGSGTTIWELNPAALTVAIDPGHGGCLDWGVPNPWDNSVANAEKTMVLEIAHALRRRLEAHGLAVVMTRTEDTAIAGDRYAPLGCDGAPFRDVNGDGLAGFGTDLPEGTLARDELQARIDLANLARADLLLSIHINSVVEGGELVEIAMTQTFYTDETAWGPTETARLAAEIQAGVVSALSGAPYERHDRGIQATNFYIVAPPLLVPTVDRPDPLRQPTRGALMPAVLSEVGSITLKAEARHLNSPDGQTAVADGLAEGLESWFAQRRFAARWEVAGLDARPRIADGSGPPFRAGVVGSLPRLALTLTNRGAEQWAEGLQLVAGWEATDAPYLRSPPALSSIDVEIPALRPGESVLLEVTLPPAAGERSVAWVDLSAERRLFSELGSPALQVASRLALKGRAGAVRSVSNRHCPIGPDLLPSCHRARPASPAGSATQPGSCRPARP